jgi:transposase
LRIESPLRLVLRWPGKSVTTVTGKDTKVMPIISHLMGITLSQSEEKTPGTRMGRPNYARELRETPGGSGLRAVRISRETGAENGINANMLFTWRRRYLAEQAQPAGLIPVVLVSDTPLRSLHHLR